MSNQRVLVLVGTSTLRNSTEKGVVDLYAQFLEGGYFEKLVVYVPYAPEDLDVMLSESIRFVQSGPKRMPIVLRPLRVLARVWRARRVGRALVAVVEPTVVRATDALIAGTLTAMICPKGTPFVVSVHSDWRLLQKLEPSGYVPRILGSRRLAELIENLVFRRADRVLAISEHVKASLVAQGVRGDSIDVLYHGIPDPLASRTAVEDLSDKYHNLDPLFRRNFTTVIVGRLSKQKRLSLVLDAAERFLKVGGRELILVGDGPERKELEARASKSPVLSKHVHFLGFLNRLDALELVKRADVVLVPLGGFTLIEAALCGKPVIAFDNEWHGELISSGETGILVRPEDPAEIARAVEQLAEDSELRDRLGRTLRLRAQEIHLEDKAQTRRRKWYSSLEISQ